MDKYIKCDETFINKATEACASDASAMIKIIDLLHHYPAADVVEVVRCKNCKHWHEDTGWCYHHSHFVGDNGEFCHPWESANWKMFDGDDYCSDEERKEGINE